MRILLVHEYYQERGGEDGAYEADGAMLEAAGHEVHRLSFANEDIRVSSPLAAAGLFLTTNWSRSAARRLKAELAATQPDLVHFHNVFPLISPAAFPAAARSGAAVVQTLHNYRLVCPNASLYRDGHVCEDCLGKRVAWPALLHACYRNSRAQTSAVVSMLALHRARKTWQKDVDLLIAPSQFLRDKLIQGGIPEDRIRVRPNLVEALPEAPEGTRDGFLFVGRLTANKGLETLMKAWVGSDMPALRIAGSGDLASTVEEFARRHPSVEYLGALSRDQVLHQMQRSTALLFPSLWFENQPLTILEAFASGLPVIASRLGAMPELIREGQTGLLFAPDDGDDLAARVRWSVSHPQEIEEMSAQVRDVYQNEFSAQQSLNTLLTLYEVALARAEDRRQASFR